MPETTHVHCYLCGAEKPFAEMSAVGSPTIENYCDPSITVDWFCDFPCFETFRNSERLRKRLYHEHDLRAREVKETLRAIQVSELEEMDSLPEGLRIPPEKRARFEQLKHRLDSVEDLQSAEDQALLLNVYRNKRKIGFCYGTSPGTITNRDYETLERDFRALEEARNAR